MSTSRARNYLRDTARLYGVDSIEFKLAKGLLAYFAPRRLEHLQSLSGKQVLSILNLEHDPSDVIKRLLSIAESQRALLGARYFIIDDDEDVPLEKGELATALRDGFVYRDGEKVQTREQDILFDFVPTKLLQTLVSRRG